MTYSVVALSRGNRYLAAATASYSLAVGNAVPALAPGVAAVVTQAYTNISFRHLALAGARRGLDPTSILADLAGVDDGFARRQVGIITADGGTAVHTGSECSAWAGAAQGDGFVVLGNLLQGPAVIHAMAQRLGDAGGTGTDETADEFAERILAALEAGQRAGGDARGQQSASLLIAANNAGDTFPPELTLDLRVDNAPAPLKELERLLSLWRDNR